MAFDKNDTAPPIRGADLLVRALADQGCDRLFGVPGESFLSVLDSLLDKTAMQFVATRQEGGAAFMADAHGKLTGRPGVCFVSRGPGAMNAAIGVHTAQQDSTPMILFVGQVERGTSGREAFQEFDPVAHFADMAKWTAVIDDPARIPELIGRAFHTAMAGRPGPVVLSLPEDVLDSSVPSAPTMPAAHPAQPAPSGAELDRLKQVLAEAKRPFVVVGGSGWSADSVGQLQRWAERDDLPIACEFRCQDLFDNTHPNYAGDIGFALAPQTAARILESDCLVLLGARMGDVPTSGYSLLDLPRTAQYLVHVHSGGEELGRVYHPDLPIHATPTGFLGAVLAGGPVGRAGRDAGWTRSCHEAHEASLEGIPPAPGKVDLADIMRAAQQILPADTIVANGAGNYSIWVHKLWRYRQYRTQLAPVSGAMGYGLPGAIAAALHHPKRRVLAVAGDGCFLMNGQELSTAVHHRLPIVTLVVNNGMLGSIRMHQERQFPGRVSATDLTNPDFAELARSYGAWGAVVEETAAFPDALRTALAQNGPSVIELRVDPEAITMRKTISDLRTAR